MENTLSHIIGQKAISSVGRMSLKTIGKKTAINALAIVIAAVVVFPYASLSFAGTILAWHGYAIAKAAIAFSVVTQAGRVARMLKSRRAPAEMIEGIPASELLDVLFREKALTVKATAKKFGTPQYRVEALVEKFREIGVLIDGPNRASQLNPKYSRQDVASIVEGIAEARNLRRLFRRDGDIMTTQPSAEAISERVKEGLAPLPQAPGFEIRDLAMAC